MTWCPRTQGIDRRSYRIHPFPKPMEKAPVLAIHEGLACLFIDLLVGPVPDVHRLAASSEERGPLKALDQLPFILAGEKVEQDLDRGHGIVVDGDDPAHAEPPLRVVPVQDREGK